MSISDQPTPASQPTNWVVGIDIGGTGIKAALVDPATGTLAHEQVRVLTPVPSTSALVAQGVAQALDALDQQCHTQAPHGVRALPIGLAFPGSIRHGVVSFVGTLNQSWVGQEIAPVFADCVGAQCWFLNDADAAGLAEMSIGAGQNAHDRSVLVVTLGTGIGTALFTRGVLYPYTEFGHVMVDGHVAEHVTSVAAKERENLSYEQWAVRLQAYFERMLVLVNPELIIVGGWISTQHQHWLPLLDLPVPVVPAHLLNDAGVVGAAMFAAGMIGGSPRSLLA